MSFFIQRIIKKVLLCSPEEDDGEAEVVVASKKSKIDRKNRKNMDLLLLIKGRRKTFGRGRSKADGGQHRRNLWEGREKGKSG